MSLPCDAAARFSTKEADRPTVIIPMFCAVYSRSNQSNRESNKSFYRVPNVVVQKGGKMQDAA